VTVSPSVLLLTIAIGVPLMLLALGVLYHAYLLSRQPLDLDDQLDQLVADPNDVMQGLQRSMQEIRGELTRQRVSLRQMLSERDATGARPAFATATPEALAAIPAMPIEPLDPASIIALAPTLLPAEPALPIDHTAGELRHAVRELLAEGLSDRAIARRLRIGLEEVRLARATTGPRWSA
jgi:hypothetical protein